MTTAYRGEAENITLPAPAGGVVAGHCYSVGGFFGVSADTVDAGVNFTLVVEDEFELAAKGTDTCTAGDPLYWDSTNGYLTTTATGNVLAGAATQDKANGDTTAWVKLRDKVTAPAAAITPPASTAATNTSPYGFTTAAQANALVNNQIAIIAALEKAGILVPH